jgi:hypothetical protein
MLAILNLRQQGRFRMITLVLYIGSLPNLARKEGEEPYLVIVEKRPCCQKLYL